jgi:hypothetical protein
MPERFVSALRQLQIELDAELVEYSRTSENEDEVEITIRNYPKALREPTPFLYATADKINRWMIEAVASGATS